MALMDEFKEERKAVLKNGTPKQKALYIWDYYKWHIIIPLIIISVIIWYIIHLITATDTLFQGIILNAYGLEVATTAESLQEDFYKEFEINTDKETISLNTSLYYTADDDSSNYETNQTLMAWNMAKELDFITGDLTSLCELAYKGYFTDLREILTEEQIAEYEPYFLYMDNDTYTLREEAIQNSDNATDIEYPDCTKPEEMNDPIPVLIDMTQCEKLAEFYTDVEDSLVIGVTKTCENKEMVLNFIEYIRE